MLDMNAQTPSAEQAIDEAREVWLRGYRDAQAAGREIPVVDVPRELGDVARTSVEATQGLAKLGNRRSFTVNVDLAAMERRRQERLTLEAAVAVAQGNRPSRRVRRRSSKGKKSSTR